VKCSLACIYIVIASSILSGQTLTVSAGRLVRIENFPSRFIQPRHIDIWLPNGYNLSKKYKVLYMQDGQQLFNADHNSNHSEWRVDETLDSLMSKSTIHDCIVVGIWNNGERKMAEYFPEKALENISTKRKKLFINDKLKSLPIADQYLKFVVFELKPYVDKNFSVFNDPDNTIIAGANAGALISLYAMCEYPSIFHAAACISSACELSDEHVSKAILNYLKKRIPDPITHRIYFDFDSSASGENAKYFQMKLNELFLKNKYTDKIFSSNEFSGNELNEVAWSKRLYLPMMFLLGK
jgi:predicted alpha/beta superfamily hydrolase